MKTRTIILILGIWIALVPILGLPNIWKNRIVSVSALVIVYLAYPRSSARKISQSTNTSTDASSS